jgi:hypothetical protein
MTANAVPVVGIHAGVNWFNINGRNATGQDLNNRLHTGFTAGLDFAIPLGGGSYFQPGVDFTQKGSRTQQNVSTRLSYIDIPLNYVYRPVVGAGNLVLGFGPYVGFGVGGQVTDAAGASTNVQYRNEFDGNLPTRVQFRKRDAGANIIAGYEFVNRLSLNMRAQLGLVNINPDMMDENNLTRNRNTGFGVSVGYRF